MAPAVRYAAKAPTLASVLTVSAFNLDTAIGSWAAGRTLETSLGSTGPAVVGTAIAALTLVPTIALGHRRPASPGTTAFPSAAIAFSHPGLTRTSPRHPSSR
ncbi:MULTISPECIES: hypothetical protein [unclassified Streptomyces]|uniref:hypothetical protein n=1 Tax=unclassified Streptomyces TaxID=2593676 RepID=UPI00368C057D